MLNEHDYTLPVKPVTQSGVSFWVQLVGWPLLTGIIAGGLSFINRHHKLDDSHIFFTYARTILETGYWSLNTPESTSGVTSPLYTLLLAFASFIFGQEVAAVATPLNILIWFGWGVVTYLLLKIYLNHPLTTCLASLMVITLPYFFTIYRMESHLTILLMAGVLLAYFKQQYFWTGVIGGLAFLARPDSVLLLIPIGVYLLWTHRKSTVMLAIGSGLVMAPWLGYAYVTFGEFLPSTLSAKLAQGQSGVWTTFYLGGLMRQVETMSLRIPTTALLYFGLASFAAVKGIQWLIQRYPLTNADYIRVFSLFFVMAHIASYGIIVLIPEYPWHYAGVIYLSLIIMVSMLEFVVGRWKDIAIALGLVVVCGFQLALTPLIYGQSFGYPARIDDYAILGQFIEAQTPPNSTIGAFEVGMLGWYSKRPIIDGLGLDNPELAQRLTTREWGYWVRHEQPDYFIFLEPIWVFTRATPQHLWTDVPWFNRAYRVYHTIPQTDTHSQYAYTIYEKVMSAEEAINQTNEPPTIAFGLDVFSDAYILGASEDWLHHIETATCTNQ